MDVRSYQFDIVNSFTGDIIYVSQYEHHDTSSLYTQSSWMDFMLRLPNCTARHQMLIMLTNSTSDIWILRLTKQKCWRDFEKTVYMYSVVLLLCNQFSPKSSQQTPQSSHVRASYGVSIVSSKSAFSFAAVIILLNIIWYVAPCYNHTRLYWIKIQMQVTSEAKLQYICDVRINFSQKQWVNSDGIS